MLQRIFNLVLYRTIFWKIERGKRIRRRFLEEKFTWLQMEENCVLGMMEDVDFVQQETQLNNHQCKLQTLIENFFICKEKN